MLPKTFPLRRASRVAVLSLMVVALAASAGCGGKKVAADAPSLKAAKASYERGEFDAAARQYRAIVAEVPEDVEARRGLALTLAAKGDNAGAIEQYEKIVAEEPKDDGSLYRMALLERLLGDTTGAIEHLQAAAYLKDSPTYFDELARTLMQAGRYADAAEAWGTALKSEELTEEGRVELLRVQAEAYASAGDPDGAKDALKEALELDSENTEIEKRLESFE